jgi:site-specific DNA-methyltransferase (adenine-specific)
MQSLPDKSIGLICTDIPYGISYHSNLSTTFNKHEEIVNDEDIFFPIDEMWRILRDDGAIFCFYSHKKPLGEFLLKKMIDAKMKNLVEKITFLSKDPLWQNKMSSAAAVVDGVAYKMFEIGFDDPVIVNSLVWVKNRQTAGDLKGDFGNRYELIAFIPKKNFTIGDNKRMSNVLEFPATNNKYHPTEKPIELIKTLVQYAPKGSIAFDPFAGGGSMPVACEKLKIPWLACEINETYWSTIEERVSYERRQLELF